MAGITVGSVSVEVVPSAATFAQKLRAQLLPQSDALGREIGKQIGDRVAKGVATGFAEGARTARAQGARAGADFAGAFDREVKTRISAALRSLPDVKVGADTSAAELRIAGIRTQLEALHDLRLGVDIDEGEALAQLAELQAQLAEIGASDPNVRVRVDAAKASGELAAMQAEVDRLDGRNIDLNVDDHGSIGEATRGLNTLMATGLALGPALIPVAGAIAAAFAGAASVFGAIGGGVLAGGLGLAGIPGAVKALNTAQTTPVSGQAAAQAALSRRSAEEAVTSAIYQEGQAERSLASAQQQARDAQQALNAARETARRQLEDMANRAKDNALSQRQAVLDVERAKITLDQVLANPGATTMAKQQAQLDYDRAVQQLSEIKQEGQRLTEDNAKAQKAGVRGSQVVIDARRRLAQANQQVRDSEHAVVLAHQQVADAQARLAVSGMAATKAQTNLQKAMAALSPEGRRFARFLFGLKGDLTDLRTVAQANLLPGLEQGIRGALPLLPRFETFVGHMAHTLGLLADEAGHALNTPFWRRFFDYIDHTAGPTLTTFVHIIENVAQGFAGLVMGFQPLTDQIGAGLLRMSQRFANFGATIQNNQAFQHFIAYMRENGPLLLHTLGDLGGLLVTILRDAAPLGPIVLEVVDAIAKLLDQLLKAHPLLGEIAIGAVTMGLGIAKIGSALIGPIGMLKSLRAALFGVAEGEAAANAAGGAGLLGKLGGAGMLGVGALGTLPLFGVGATPDTYDTTGGSKLVNLVMDVGQSNKAAGNDLKSSGLGTGKGGTITIGNQQQAIAFVEKYGNAQQQAAAAALAASGANQTDMQSLFGLDAASSQTRDGLQALTDSLNGLGQKNVDATQAAVDYQSALDAATQSAKLNGRSIDANTAAGQANLQALLGLRTASDNYILSMIGQGRTLQQVKPQIEQNYRNFVQTAEAVGATKSQAEDLAKKYGLLPKDVITQIRGEGLNDLNKGLDHLLDTIVKVNGKQIHVHYDATSGEVTFRSGGSRIGMIAKAGGGYISGPGSATSDSIPALLSNGEYVVKAASVDRYGVGLLDAINAGRFATGGHVRATEQLLAAAQVLETMSRLGGAGGPTSSGAAVNLGRTMAAARGWIGPQFDALNKLWTRESGWRWNATNPTSGAYGIPQSLPASKMASAGGDWLTNPATQIRWGLGYIAGRYGNPVSAWAHETAYNWYDQGGYLPPGVSTVVNGTGRPEPVLTPAQWDAMARGARGGDGLGLPSIEQHFHGHTPEPLERAEMGAALAHAVRTLTGG